MSKGSNRRPAAVPEEVVAERWERAFPTYGDPLSHFGGSDAFLPEPPRATAVEKAITRARKKGNVEVAVDWSTTRGIVGEPET